MPDTINLAGMTVKKSTALLGGAGLAGVFGIAWYRSKKQQTQSQIPADNTQIDPATGFPYGSPEDSAALQSQVSYVSPSGVPFGGGSSFPISGGFNTGNGGPPFTSNSQWAQYVEQFIVDQTQADPATVGNALGKYITGQPLSDTMVGIVQEAIAFGEYPPVSGPNGYPPSYRTAPPVPVPVPTPVPVPKPGPNPKPVAHVPATPTGAHAASIGQTDVNLAWNVVSGAAGYNVSVTEKGNTVKHVSAQHNSATVSGLKRHTTYRFWISGHNSAGWGKAAMVQSTTR